MAKKTKKETEILPLKRPLEQAFRERAIADHKSQAGKAYVALADDVTRLGAQGRSSEELSFILARKGVAHESATLLPEFNEKFSDCDSTVLRTKSPSQSAIDALMRVEPDVRAVAIARIKTGATLGGADILLVADELHRSSLPHDEQRSLDLHRLVEQQTSRLATEGRHPFQNELTALLDLCDEYANLVYIREIEFEDFKAEGLTRATQPPSSARELNSVKKRARKVLDSFDDLFEWAEVPRSKWAHLYWVDPNASLLAQARYSLEQIAGGNLNVLDRTWSKHFPLTGGAALRYLLGTPPAKTTNRNRMTRPTRILNAMVIGRGTLGVALGLEAAGYAIRATYEDDEAARANIRSRRSDWKVQKAGVNGNDALYTQLKRNRVGEDLNLLAGILGKEAWDVRADTNDRYPQHARLNELLAELTPDAFFFELPPKAPARDLMALEIHRLGYELSEFSLTLTDFHVPQARTRTVFCGIKKSFGTRINPPVVMRKPINFVSYLEDTIRVRGMSSGMSKWRNKHLKKETIEGKLDDPRYRSVPDLATIREDRSKSCDAAWLGVGLTPRIISAVPIAPPENENFLPLSIPLLKQLQGIPGKWALSGSVDDQLSQIIETVPPIIARMLGHQIHAAQTGEFINLDAAVEERMTMRGNRAVAPEGNEEVCGAKECADLYEREVLAQEEEMESKRSAEEKASRTAVTQPRSFPPPPPSPKRQKP